MKHLYRLILSLLAIAFSQFNLYAQEVTIGNGVSSTEHSPILINKVVPHKYSRTATVYTATELIAAGANAGQIRNIAWYRTNPAGNLHPNNNGKLKIYLKGVSFSTFDSTNKSWQLFTNNASIVFNDSTINLGSKAGWKEINFNSPFTWNGTENLLVLVEWENPDTSASTIEWRYAAITNTNMSVSSNALNTVRNLQRNSIRPNTKFGFTKNSIDAELLEVLVEKGKCVGSAASVQLKIRNNSNSTISNLILNWSINGVSQSQVIHSTSISSASDTILSIGIINFATNNNNDVKAWITSVNGITDQYNLNDTLLKIAAPSLSGNYTVASN